MGRTRTIIIGDVPAENEELKHKAVARVAKPKSIKTKVSVSADTSDGSATADLNVDSQKKQPDSVEINSDDIPAVANEEEPQPETKPKQSKILPKLVKQKKKQNRSSRYLQSAKSIDRAKRYSLDDAIDLLKKTSYSKFDGTVEVHIKTISKKGQDPLRGLVMLPSGAPKQKIIAIADEALIEKVQSSKIDFDILIATPTMMPKLATVAKILGPKGLMPNPKSGTVVEDTAVAQKELSSGKIEYKTDLLGNIHCGVAKLSWENNKIKTNINAFLNAIPANRVGSITLCATMGPGIKIK